MATSYGNPPVVTNGLILMLDSGNIQSYVPSSTSFIDLAQKDITTLYNTPTYSSQYGGIIGFNGTDEYGEIVARDTSLEFQPTQPYSCYVFYQSPASAISGALISNMPGAYPFTGWDLWFNNTSQANTIAMHLIADWTSANAIKVRISYDFATYANKWLSFGYSYDGSNPTTEAQTLSSVEFYLNGISQSAGKSIDTNADGFSSAITYNTSQRFRLATRWAAGGVASGQTSSCSLGIVMVYNRKLSAAEFLQNYEALRSRYDI